MLTTKTSGKNENAFHVIRACKGTSLRAKNLRLYKFLSQFSDKEISGYNWTHFGRNEWKFGNCLKTPQIQRILDGKDHTFLEK